MKLTELNIYRYHLRLNRPLTSVGKTQTHRDGLIIRAVSDTGSCGYGETAPLPGLSNESIHEAAEQMQTLRKAIFMSPVPDKLEELSGGFAQWLGHIELFPSVRFGFESAVLNMIAHSRNIPLDSLLCSNPHRTVPINGLLAGDMDEVAKTAAIMVERGLCSLKLKVGRQSLEDDITLTRQVLEQIPEQVSLRLDANRAWGINDAFTFGKAVAGWSIEYIEEPCKSLTLLREMLLKPAMLVGLDESLTEIEPEELRSFSGVKAIVLKPTVLGLERAMQFARATAEQNIIAVISSSFESRVGLTCLARMAACLNNADVAIGLGTEDWFAENLIDSSIVDLSGLINMANLPDLSDNIRHECLQDITND